MSGLEKRSSLRRTKLARVKARMVILVAGAAEAKAEERRVVTEKERVKERTLEKERVTVRKVVEKGLEKVEKHEARWDEVKREHFLLLR